MNYTSKLEATLDNYGFTTQQLLELHSKLKAGDIVQRTGKDGTRVQLNADDRGFDWTYHETK